MKTRLIATAAAVALIGSAAMAQTATTAGSHNPALKDSTAAHVAAPAEGANSFTQAQAKGRIAKAGYTGVSGLAKDKDGVWRGMAMKGGKKVSVDHDYKGNVTTH